MEFEEEFIVISLIDALLFFWRSQLDSPFYFHTMAVLPSQLRSLTYLQVVFRHMLSDEWNGAAAFGILGCYRSLIVIRIGALSIVALSFIFWDVLWLRRIPFSVAIRQFDEQRHPCDQTHIYPRYFQHQTHRAVDS